MLPLPLGQTVGDVDDQTNQYLLVIVEHLFIVVAAQPFAIPKQITHGLGGVRTTVERGF